MLPESLDEEDAAGDEEDAGLSVDLSADLSEELAVPVSVELLELDLLSVR